MTCMLFTLLLTSIFWIALAVYGLRRVLNNLRNNPEALGAITQHVLTPVFGDKELPFAQEEKT